MGEKFRLRLGQVEHELEVERLADSYRVRLGGAWHRVDLQQIGDSAHYSLIVDDRPCDFFAEESTQGYHIVIGCRSIPVTTRGTLHAWKGPRALETEQSNNAGEWILLSPMSGVVQEVMVSVGDDVEAGAVLMVIEAMKMQNELQARRAGAVRAIYVNDGQRVEQGMPLLVLL